jgi:hypothetical protein
MTRMDGHAQELEGEVQRLQTEVGHFHALYAQSHDERAELIEQVASLEQERAELMRRLTSLPELRLAIREAIATRTEQDEQGRLARLQARRDAEAALFGNRGYLMLEGSPTSAIEGQPAMAIRVHDPEPMAPASSQ